MAAGDLPVRLSSFVGRKAELTELSELVLAHRLVTVTGPGGGGKTRLAVALADRLRSRYGHRVRWLGLAGIPPRSAVDRVLAALADAFELSEETIESAVTALAGEPSLLVVDNCEHVLETAAPLLGELLRACPGLTVLATSQEALGIAGEAVYRLPPLKAEAARLFVDRAQAVSHGFELTEANGPHISAICTRLDGVPLAIELAAAWAPTLGVAQIAARLDDTLAVLTQGDREAMPRHRTLRAALDWSWDLLEKPEQELLAQLSVFHGGFSVDAVEAVAQSEDVLRSLSRLVNRSLVMVEQSDQAQYRLLRIVQQYAASRLGDDSGPAERLAQHALDLLQRAAGRWEGAEQQEWLDLFVAERDGLQTALTWHIDRGEAEQATKLVVGLWWPSYLLGRYRETRDRLERVLAMPGPVPPDLRTEAELALGTMAHLQGEADLAEVHLRVAFNAMKAAGDLTAEARELHWLGGAAMRRGEYDEARRLGERCIALWRTLDHPSNLSRAIDYLGMRELLAGELDRAEALLREARSRYESDGAGEGLGWTTVLLAGVEHYRGESAVARTLLGESRRLAERTNSGSTLAWTLQFLGLEERRAGRLDAAEDLLSQSLQAHNDHGNRWRAASILEALALTALARRNDRGQLRRAVRLLGHATSLRARLGTPVPAVEADEVSAGLQVARAALPLDEFRTAWAEGEIWSLEKVAEVDPTSRPASPPITIAETRVDALRIVALGVSEVHRNDTLLDAADWGYAKPRELFQFLLGSGPVSKGRIGAELWPDVSAQTLRNSFHTCLHQVRRTLGRSDWITFRGGRYEFNQSLEYAYDVADLEAAAAVGDLARVIDLYRGDYLTDVTGASWIDERRESLRQTFERSLIALAEAKATDGHVEESIDLYQRAVSHDPLLESAHRALISLHLIQGDRAAAVRQYNTVTEILATELRTTPSPQTTALLQ
ncbi:BTAD domain-containing putative transcriptional regulator [Kribbella albertanoniae]|uniref:Tetratricopeptide repeat protein n=1 Tax=Kribbella albertanoniae TaxID=1266829 RepID=A0A4R4Q7S7_9ACTN|nr:BTAD domain-containing putative transcriptional regulator [Kribbella albertanoniae]TDC30983.1 tetratricopeptide repeat protein [Kribbella albertanoniae]